MATEADDDLAYYNQGNEILLGGSVLLAFSVGNVLLVWAARRIRRRMTEGRCCCDVRGGGCLWLPGVVKNALRFRVGYRKTNAFDDNCNDDGLFVDTTVTSETSEKPQEQDIEHGGNRLEDDDNYSGTTEDITETDYHIPSLDEIKRRDILNRFIGKKHKNRQEEHVTTEDPKDDETAGDSTLVPPRVEPIIDEVPSSDSTTSQPRPPTSKEKGAMDHQFVLDALSGLGGASTPHRDTHAKKENKEEHNKHAEQGIPKPTSISKAKTQDKGCERGNIKAKKVPNGKAILNEIRDNTRTNKGSTEASAGTNVASRGKDYSSDSDKSAAEVTLDEIKIPKITLEYEVKKLDENRRNDILNRNSLCRQDSSASLNSRFHDDINAKLLQLRSPGERERSYSWVGVNGAPFDRANLLNRANSFNAKLNHEEPQQRRQPYCTMCNKKFFPTDKTFTARKRVYHIGCYRCTLCATKMINHPKEVHRLESGDSSGKQQMILHCRQCVLDNLYKDQDHARGRAAGESITISADEQGDIDQVVEAIGDDLEEAMMGMIPKCATCGGDFLSYTGNISIVGSLKYHNECFLYGKPVDAEGCGITLDPVQGSKSLPETFIMKLSSAATGKAITTLFFVWKGKEEAIKSLRSKRPRAVSATFVLDENAPANPNFNGRRTKKTTVTLPTSSDDWGCGDLMLSVVGADELAPKQIHPVTIMTNNSMLVGAMGYSKYTLDHTLKLTIPCSASDPSTTSDGSHHVLNLLGATLVVNLQRQQSSSGGAESPILGQ